GGRPDHATALQDVEAVLREADHDVPTVDLERGLEEELTAGVPEQVGRKNVYRELCGCGAGGDHERGQGGDGDPAHPADDSTQTFLLLTPDATHRKYLADLAAEDEDRGRVVDPEDQHHQGGEIAVRGSVVGDVGHVPPERQLEQLEQHGGEGGGDDGGAPVDLPGRKVAVHEEEHRPDREEGDDAPVEEVEGTQVAGRDPEGIEAESGDQLERHGDADVEGEQGPGRDDHLHVEELPGDDAAPLLNVEDFPERSSESADEPGG